MNLPRFSIQDKDAAYQYFRENGLVIFNDLAPQDLLDQLRAQLSESIQLQSRKHLSQDTPFQPGNGFDQGLIELAQHNNDLRRRFYEVIQDLSSLYRFCVDPSFEELAREMGIEIPILRTSQIRMDLPHEERFLIPPHQEVRSIRSPNMVFMITALVDISEQKGALQASPGSFKLGPILPEVSDEKHYQFIPEEKYQEKYPIQQVPLKAGETLFLNMYTIHGSSPNNSDETRWSIICRFEDLANMPYVDGDDCLDSFNRKG